MKIRKDVQEPTITPVEGLSVTRTEHPAFAMIGAHHVHGPRVLFGSDFEHQGYIDIVIKRATSERRHSTDNFHGQEELISVSLSHAQWATFLSSMNLGDGVPCTLSHIKREKVPQIALPIPNRDKFRADHQAHLDEAVAEVKVARTYEAWDPRTGQLTPASEEAKAKAFANWTEAARSLARFDLLHPEPVAA